MSFRNESLFEICVGPISQRNTPGSITSPDTGEPFTQLYRKLTVVYGDGGGGGGGPVIPVIIHHLRQQGII
jgi:hypothetical protein